MRTLLASVGLFAVRGTAYQRPLLDLASDVALAQSLARLPRIVYLPCDQFTGPDHAKRRRIGDVQVRSGFLQAPNLTIDIIKACITSFARCVPSPISLPSMRKISFWKTL